MPLRFNWDEQYPAEQFKVMPKGGYTAKYENMLDHPNITVETGVLLGNRDIGSLRRASDATIYTGRIDAYFDECFGRLGYRSLRFEWKHFDQPYAQPCVQINYPNDFAYTRTVEIKHATGQETPGTTVCYEYPESVGGPFYPLLTHENTDRYARYKALAERESSSDHPLHFVGRLAEFRYYNMDQVLLRAISLANGLLTEWL
jgi:UDP-galactopyranose mutase